MKQNSAADFASTVLAVLIALALAVPVAIWVMVLEPIWKLATGRKL